MGGTTTRRSNRVIGWVADRGLRTKFLLVIAVGVLSAVGVGFTAVSGMSSMQAQTRYLYAQNLLPIEDLATMQRSIQTMRIALLNALIAEGKTSTETYLQQISDEDAVFDKAFASYTSTDMTGRQAAVQRLEQSLAEYRRIRDTYLVPSTRTSNIAEFRRVRDRDAGPALTTLYGALDDLVKIETASAAEQNAEAADTASRSRLLVIANLLVGVAAAVGLGAC